MATPIKEGSWGLVPMSQPKLYKTYTVNTATTVLRFQPVRLDATTKLLEPVVVGEAGVIGVAMAHGTAGDEVIVVIDPDCIYEATGHATYGDGYEGEFTNLVNNATTGPTSEVSGVLVNMASPSATPAATDHIQIIGAGGTVQQGTNQNVLVKLCLNTYVSP